MSSCKQQFPDTPNGAFGFGCRTGTPHTQTFRWKKLGIFLAVSVLLLLAVACAVDRIEWDDLILGSKLPDPSQNLGKVYTNAADKLWVRIPGLNAKEFYDYSEACKQHGFVVDASADSYSFSAYNADGYCLSLSYLNEILDVKLEAPMEMSSISWPESIAAQQLPVPASTIGQFTFEYEDSFFVYIGNTSKTDYAEYVNACSEKGFLVDYRKGEDYYEAENSDGWYVSVRYVGNSIMSIDIDPPSETPDAMVSELPSDLPQSEDAPIPCTDSPAPTDEPIESEPDATEARTGLSPDFKEAMDSYEDFIDEYIAFMERYADSNGTDLSILADYAKFMTEYAEFCAAFAEWGEKDLNAEELAYYTEVQARVNQKLLEIVY